MRRAIRQHRPRHTSPFSRSTSSLRLTAGTISSPRIPSKVEFSSNVYKRAQVCRLIDDKKKTEITNPIDALEHANAEVEAAHIHRIGSFSFAGSHIRGGLGPVRHMRSSSCRSVDRGVDIIIDQLILRFSSVREAQWVEKMVRKDGQ